METKTKMMYNQTNQAFENEDEMWSPISQTIDRNKDIQMHE